MTGVINAIYGISLTFHSIFRWIVIIVGIVALVRYLYGWLRRETPFGDADAKLAIAYASVLTVQFILGLINIVCLLLIGGFNPAKDIEHTLYGLIAVGLAHVGARRWKDAPDRTRFRNLFLIVLATLLLALLSVWRLRGSFLYGLI